MAAATFAEQVASFQDRDAATEMLRQLGNALRLKDCPAHVVRPIQVLINSHQAWKRGKDGVSHSIFVMLGQVFLKAVRRNQEELEAAARLQENALGPAKERLAAIEAGHVFESSRGEAHRYAAAFRNYLAGKEPMPQPRSIADVVIGPDEFMFLTRYMVPKGPFALAPGLVPMASPRRLEPLAA